MLKGDARGSGLGSIVLLSAISDPVKDLRHSRNKVGLCIGMVAESKLRAWKDMEESSEHTCRYSAAWAELCSQGHTARHTSHTTLTKVFAVSEGT